MSSGNKAGARTGLRAGWVQPLRPVQGAVLFCYKRESVVWREEERLSGPRKHLCLIQAAVPSVWVGFRPEMCLMSGCIDIAALFGCVFVADTGQVAVDTRTSEAMAAAPRSSVFSCPLDVSWDQHHLLHLCHPGTCQKA